MIAKFLHCGSSLILSQFDKVGASSKNYFYKVKEHSDFYHPPCQIYTKKVMSLLANEFKNVFHFYKYYSYLPSFKNKNKKKSFYN